MFLPCRTRKIQQADKERGSEISIYANISCNIYANYFTSFAYYFQAFFCFCFLFDFLHNSIIPLLYIINIYVSCFRFFVQFSAITIDRSLYKM